MALLVSLCLLWGVQQITVKYAIVQGIPPLQLATMRSAFAAVCLAGWVGWSEGWHGLRAMLRRDETTLPGAIIAAAFALEFLALNLGLRLTTASRGVLFLYTAPFFVAAGAHLFIPGERLGRLPAFGLVLAFAGVCVAFADGLRRPGGSLGGDALCVLAAVLYAATTLMLKTGGALSRASASRVLLYQLAGSAPLLLAASLAWGEAPTWPRANALAWAAVFYQSVVVAFASYLAWFWLVLNYPANRISGFTFLVPVFGVAAGALVLHEPVGWSLLAGFAAVATGLTLLGSAR